MSPFILDETVLCGYVIGKIPMRRVIGLTGKTAIKRWPPDDPLTAFLDAAKRRRWGSGSWLSSRLAEPLPDPWRRTGRSCGRPRQDAEHGMASHG
jgi:hypothetical protein